MSQLSLRLRVFLFFALLAFGALFLAAASLGLGWSRAEPALPPAPFVTAFVAFAIFNTGLLLLVWLLFDENVAKPINRLSADLRIRVHAEVRGGLDTVAARYLGDLAPAAAALTERAETFVHDTATHVARETERLSAEHARLTALLTESPIATILVNPAHEIVLYDAQAAAVLSSVAVPRLSAPLWDYFERDSLADVFSRTGISEKNSDLRPIGSDASLNVRVRELEDSGYILFFDPPEKQLDTVAPRPLIFDFDLITSQQSGAQMVRPLSQLCYVVLDLETTGLSVETDAIVQLAAVRVLNNAIVPGEEVSTYVDPGRSIPPASTRIHHVSDSDVVDAPTIAVAGQRLHHFASDSVLVAHNAPFDIGLLRRHEEEIGVVWDHVVIDTVLLSSLVFGTTEQHSLDALCDRLSIKIAPEDRHTALGDAKATAEALVRLMRMLEGKGFQTLADLQPALEREARRLYAAT